MVLTDTKSTMTMFTHSLRCTQGVFKHKKKVNFHYQRKGEFADTHCKET